jgi:hypothetical protein
MAIESSINLVGHDVYYGRKLLTSDAIPHMTVRYIHN